MKTLLKIAAFCLIFLVVSQVSFGQTEPAKTITADDFTILEQGKQDSVFRTVTQDNRTGEIYTYTEMLPEFPGGKEAMLAYLNTNLRYPKKALQKKVSGTVVVKFDLTETGAIANAFVFKSDNALLDEEALRLINEMPRWRPGMQNGKPVTVSYNFPIIFRINRRN